MKLSKEQKEAVAALVRFLEDENSNIFLLKGYAGSGKTYIIRSFAEALSSFKIPFSLMAATGRATKVLQSRTGMNTATIHRSIYRFEEEYVSIGQKSYQIRFSLRNNQDSANRVYIIDEASMISDYKDEGDIYRFGSGRFLSDIVQYAGLPGSDRKIIFVGDPAQLPPVTMPVSPALDCAYLERNFSVAVKKCTLTDVLRQNKQSGILKTAMELRNQLHRRYPNRVCIMPDGEHLQAREKQKDFKDYRDIIRKEDIPSAIWICSRNRDASLVNQEMRLQLSYFHQVVTPGELLMVTMNNYHQSVFMMNGDQLRVSDVSDWVERRQVVFNFGEKKGIRKTLAFRRITVRPFDDPERHIPVIILENALCGKEDIPELRAALYVDLVKRHSKAPKELFEEAKKTDPYYHALIARYGYAITCHKAQGGEWKRIFLDLHHKAPPDSHSFIRWAYTALTRSTNTVCLQNPVHFDAESGFIVEPVEHLGCKRNLVPCTRSIDVNKTDHATVRQCPFLKQPLTQIERLLEECGIAFTLTHFPYKARFFCHKDDGGVVVDINYNKKGIKNEIGLIRPTHTSFAEDVRVIMQSVLDGQPYVYNPGEDFRKSFFNLLQHTCREAGVSILNALEQNYADTFVLRTDAKQAELICYYNKKSRYTRIQPRSPMADADKKLCKVVSMLK